MPSENRKTFQTAWFLMYRPLGNGICKHCCHIETFLFHDFLESGRAGHVDFGQVASDNIQTGKQDASPFKLGSQILCNFSVAFAQFLSHAAPACRQIAACFAVLRNTRQSIGDDFSTDNQDAFVTVYDFGSPRLRW